MPQRRPSTATASHALALLLAAGALAPPASRAQAPAPTPSEAAVTLALPAQPLGEALNELARRAGLQLLARSELVAGRQAPALNGRMTVREALDRLLAGTGLAASIEGASVIVRPAPAAAAAGGEGPPHLPPVVVRAAPDRGPGESRAAGFSSRGARVGVLGDRDLLDVPFSIQVAPRELLDSAGVTDLKGLARLDAAVTPVFSLPGYYDSVSIRGLDLHNWDNYYKNGTPFPNQAKTAFENLERIEVRRGLSGFMQGFAAPGGTVNYVTERPTPAWQSRAEVRLDGDGTLMPGIDVGGPLTDDGRWGLRLNAAGGREGSYVDRVRTDRAFGSLALDWKPDSAVTVQLDAQMDRRKGTTQPSLPLDVNGDLPRGVKASRYLGQPWQTYTTRTREVGLQTDWRFSRDWTAQLRLSDAYLDRDDFGSNIGNLQPDGSFDVFEYKSADETRHTTYAELALRGWLRTGPVTHELGIGASTRRLKARFAGDSIYQAIGESSVRDPVFVPDPQTPPPPSGLAIENKDRALFLSDFITFDDRWQALLGLRRSEVDFYSIFAARPYRRTVVTPSVALIFKPQATTSLYVSYVEGLEQGDTAPETASNANAQLKPITAEQIEIGLKREWLDGRLSTTAALFQIERPLSYVNSGTGEFGYFGQRQHRGFELSVAGEVRPGTRINTGLVLLRARALDTGDAAVDGQVPDGVAARQFNLWVDQTLPAPGWSAQFGLRAASRRAATSDGSTFVPGWAVADAGLRYRTRMQSQALDVALHVYNLANRFYYESTGFGSLSVGSARSVSLAASLSF